MAEFTLDRRDILPRLFPQPDKYLIVTGLAGAAKDTAAYTKEADNVITLGGAMGAAVSWGLVLRFPRRARRSRSSPVMAS